MRTQRLIAIILLLEARGKIRAQDLATAFQTSERTIYRDIEDLCAAGIPIETQSGPHGGLSLAENYSLDSLGLEIENIINLYLCGTSIRPEAHVEVTKELWSALQNLEQNLPTDFKEDIQKARQLFYFDPTPRWQRNSEPIHLDKLRKAVWQASKVRLEYINGSKGSSYTTKRVVCPYGLVVRHGEWYVVGHCEMRQAVRAFKCERIRSVTTLEETFFIPRAFNLETFWLQWIRESQDSFDRA